MLVLVISIHAPYSLLPDRRELLWLIPIINHSKSLVYLSKLTHGNRNRILLLGNRVIFYQKFGFNIYIAECLVQVVLLG